jgi:hypothetical protein
MGKLNSDNLCEQPHLGRSDPRDERHELVEGGVLAVRHRGVAVQVDPFEKANFETRFSLHRLKGWNQTLSSAMGQLALSSYGSTAFSLYSPTE